MFTVGHVRQLVSGVSGKPISNGLNASFLQNSTGSVFRMLSNHSLRHAKVPVAYANTLGITMQVEMSPGWVLLELRACVRACVCVIKCVCVCV